MSRALCEVPQTAHINDILVAAEVWRKHCLMDDGSIFSDESLWTPVNINRLLDRFADDRLLEGREPFVDKLERQLEGTEPIVKRLAAEVFWFLYLIPWSTDTQSKRDKVSQIWEWSGRPMPESDYLGDQTLKGIATPGRAYFRWLHFELRFLLQIAHEWKQLPEKQQSEFSQAESAWAFAKWLDSLQQEIPEIQQGRRAIRNAILFFLYPDHFERSISYKDKREIVKNLGFRLPENLRPSNRKVPIIQIDRAIYRIRQHLEKEYGDTPLDFYYPPIIEMWKKKKDEQPSSVPTSQESTTDPENCGLNTILYGPPGTGKTYATTRQCVEICDGRAPESDEETRARYVELVEEGRIEFITFHQSYGYEEFVEGLRPEIGSIESANPTSPGFHLVAKDGVLKRIAERARKAPEQHHVLVIDEINRANVSKVLGELVTLLEEDKRQGAGNEVSVVLPHSGDRFTLPSNLYILGTMNTADRSIALLDTALRRRFDFVELAPEAKRLQGAAEMADIDLPKVLKAMNERLEWLIDRDHQIGHAWLMKAKMREDVDRIMRHKIIPLIAEYFYDDWKKVRAVLGGTDDFVERKPLKSPPGLDDEMGEERYRWTVRESFKNSAYDALVSGQSSTEEGSEE